MPVACQIDHGSKRSNARGHSVVRLYGHADAETRIVGCRAHHGSQP